MIRVFAYLFTTISILIVCLLAYSLYFNAPFMDEFDTVIVSLKLSSSLPQYLYSFLPGHNGHELIVPYVLYALNFYFFSGSRASFMIFILILQLLFLLLNLIYVRKLFGIKDKRYYFLLPLISIFIFNPFAFDFWSHIDDIPYSLASLFFFCGIMVFSNNMSKRSIFLMVSFLSVLCSLNLMNGLIVWPTCFLLLIFLRFSKKQLIFYMVFAVIVIIFYRHFTDLSKNSMATISFYDRTDYFFTFLGGIFGMFFQNLQVAFYLGIFAFAVWVLLSIYLLIKKSSVHDKSLFMPWIFLAFLPIGSAVLGAIGRVQFGTAQALAVRYEPLTALLWISILVLSVYIFQNTRPMLMRIILYVAACLVYFATVVILFMWAISFTGSAINLQIITLGLYKDIYIANDTIPNIYPANDKRILEDLSYLRTQKLYFASSSKYKSGGAGIFEQGRKSLRNTSYSFTISGFDSVKEQLPVCEYGFSVAHSLNGMLELHNYHPKWLGAPENLLFVDEKNKIVGEAVFDSTYFYLLHSFWAPTDYTNKWLGYVVNSTSTSDVHSESRALKVYLKYYRDNEYYALGTVNVPYLYGCE